MAPRWRTANDSTGVGCSSVKILTGMPAEVSTFAASCANSCEWWRES